jgi:predicted nucleotidyltransferase
VNTKQETAIRIIAAWADRFGCVTRAVIYGSVARGDEGPTSDLDVDLEYVSDLTAPGMARSYTEAQGSFEDLSNHLFREIGHRLRLSNYVKHHVDVSYARNLVTA